MDLERKLSTVNVWALAFGCIIGWGAFVMPGNTFLIKGGPLGTAIAMSIAALMMVIIAFNYYYMINKFPVAGGEFSYAQNAFGGNHGFICSWFLGLSYLAIVPLNATALALVGRCLMNNVFQVGFHYTVASYDVYLGEILLAEIALLLLAWFSIRGAKITGILQTILAIVLVGGVCVIVIATIVSGNLSVSNLSPGFYPSNSNVSGVLSIIAVAPWAFVGFDTIPQAVEEFEFSHKKAKGLMVLSILFGALVYILLNTITACVIPKGYESWVEYIDDLDNLNGLLALPTFHAAYQLLGNVGLFVLGCAVLAAILSGILGFYMATSRLFYAMSKENVLPKIFSSLHKKYKTPVFSIIFVLAVSLIAPLGGRIVLGWIVDMSSIGAAIGYGYTSAAAFKYAKEEQNIGVMISGAIGIIMAIGFGLLLLVPFPMSSCHLGKESYICLIIWIIMGIIFHKCAVKKNIHR